MDSRTTKIEAAIQEFPGASLISPFSQRGNIIYGRISFTEGETTLDFDVEVYPQYPFQFHESETIKFINKNLLSYDHVNNDGSICVHTVHHPQLSEKIAVDLNGLRHWIIKYYINGETDKEYEHIVVNPTAIDNCNHVFLFTEVDYLFKTGMHGKFTYSLLSGGNWRKEEYNTYLIQKFMIKGHDPACNWSSFYHREDVSEGLFYYSDKPPVENRRFAVNSFHQLENYFSQEFIRYMEAYRKQAKLMQRVGHAPLLVGYPISESEIHWQAILIPLDEFPNYGQKVGGTNNWVSRLRMQPIIWAQTRNSSYSYFFGRGAFNSSITKAKILIIGIGAIGSMVATTLVRGGAIDLSFIDHDVKEPENICRSEYDFAFGLTAKTNELMTRLTTISPFVKVSSNETLIDLFKIVIQENEGAWRNAIKSHLDNFDIIFDCSTDNDVAFLLGSLGLKGDIFSLSMTNNASELICATKNNLYQWLQQIFHQLEKQTDDLYKPTGCWSPTFKASYNDVAVLIQKALHHINTCYKKSIPVRHFYLSNNEDYETFKLTQF